MQTYFPVLGVLGMMLMLFGLVMGFPLAVSFALDDGATAAYDLAILATFASGLLMWTGTRGAKRDLRVSDGFLLVAATPPKPVSSPNNPTW